LPSAGDTNPVIVVNKLPLSEVVRAAFVVLGLMGGGYRGVDDKHTAGPAERNRA